MGGNLEDGDLLGTEEIGDGVLGAGDDDAAEVVVEALAVEGAHRADELHEEFAGIDDLQAKLTVGAHREHDAILRIEGLDGRRRAPLDVEADDLVDVPDLGGERRAAARGDLEDLPEDRVVGRVEGVATGEEGSDRLAALEEEGLLGLRHDHLGPRAELFGRVLPGEGVRSAVPFDYVYDSHVGVI